MSGPSSPTVTFEFKRTPTIITPAPIASETRNVSFEGKRNALPSLRTTDLDTSVSNSTDGMSAPYPPPPPAPRYCTRQTAKQMEATSQDTTRRELEKLAQLQTAPPHPKATPLTPPKDAVSLDTAMHQMMHQNMDRLQVMYKRECEQNDTIVQLKQDIVQLRKDTSDALSETEHYKEVSDGYENDIEELVTERDAMREERDVKTVEIEEHRIDHQNALTRVQEHAANTACRHTTLYLMLLALYMLQLNDMFNLDLQARYHDGTVWVRRYLWMAVAYCVSESVDAREPEA